MARSRDPDAKKVDPRMSWTVGDSTARTKFAGEEASLGRALGASRARHSTPDGIDITIAGCTLLRLVGHGFDPIDLFEGLDAGADGWRPAGDTAGRSKRSVRWGALGGERDGAGYERKSHELHGGTGKGLPALADDDPLGSENLRGASSGSGISSVVSRFGGGIIDLKDAFDALGLPSAVTSRRGTASEDAIDSSDTSRPMVLEVTALPRCMSRIGLGIANGIANKFLRD